MTDARLIAIAGPSTGTVWPITSPLTVGRDDAACVIPDAAISRRHCAIALAADGWTITDLDSRNGTSVNGIPIHSQLLADGDQIRIGDSVLVYAAGVAHHSTGNIDSTKKVFDFDELAGPVTFASDQHVDYHLVGQSTAMRDVLKKISRAARADSTVLIQGESGTGKELVARAIHVSSGRASGPFVTINCAAIPEALLESELFGHERGAFTGALTHKRGLIELATRGTVFLDEIGELSLSMQAKLLRVLQQRQIDRIAGSRPIDVDIRVVAATNLDLPAAVKGGRFRSDLFYRLNVIVIAVPPLRERPGDVALLIPYFLRKYASQCKRRISGITRAAMAILARYDWPGNVRELENAIERAVVMSTGSKIDVADLPEHLLEAGPIEADDGYHARVNQAKREAIRSALDLAGGNVAQAARQLKLQVTYLHRLMTNLGIRDAGSN